MHVFFIKSRDLVAVVHLRRDALVFLRPPVFPSLVSSFRLCVGVKPSYSGVAVVMWGKNGNGASSFQSVLWGQGDTLWFASLAALALRMSFASPLLSRASQSGNASGESWSLFPSPLATGRPCTARGGSNHI